MKSGQVGGIVVARKKFTTLAYSEDLTLMAKTVAKKANVGKFKVLVFKKEGKKNMIGNREKRFWRRWKKGSTWG